VTDLKVISPLVDLQSYGMEPRLPEVCDASSMNDYLNCPSLYYHRHVLGLAAKGPEAPHFSWGTRWHDVLFTYYHEYSLNDALEVLIDDWPDTLGDLDPKARTLDRMLKIFPKYVEDIGIPAQKAWEVVRREQYFDVECPADNPDCPYPWKGCDLRWCGRMDKISELLRRKHDYVHDYKTTGYLHRHYFDSHKHGIQIPGYCWGASHLLGRLVRHARVDLLHCTKTQFKFEYRDFRYGDERIWEWLQNVKQVWAEIRGVFGLYSDQPELWIKNWNECKRLWDCPFVDVHHTVPLDDRETRMAVLEQDYIVDRWDPSHV